MQVAKPAIRRSDSVNSAAWLEEFRDRFAASWETANWPTRKAEDWKYTRLRSLEKSDFDFSHPADVQAGVGPQNFADVPIDAYKLVYINGVYSVDQSDLNDLPEGIELLDFSSADDAQSKTINAFLNQQVDVQKHIFAALNSAVLNNGTFLYVPPGIKLPKPVLVVHKLTNDCAAQFAPRLLAVLEPSASAEIIEQFVSPQQGGEAFSCGLTEIFVRENAQVSHYRLHMEGDSHKQIGGVHIVLERHARLDAFHLALGCELQRVDLVVNHLGEGSESRINGVYLPNKKQHVDYHTCIEHSVPHCTSEENFRGIIGDEATAVFNGRIHIHPQAQKTLAQLNNRNLLTSERAEVDTKPELEIYADDVQCAHGATVAQIDQQALHYFLTRGISLKEAEVMLSFGFINELLNTIKLSEVADYLRPLLADRFARDPNLLRHIA